MTRTKKILFVESTENARKFYGVNNLQNGDTVLYLGTDDSFINYAYTKPKIIGKWQINLTEYGSAPPHLFREISSIN